MLFFSQKHMNCARRPVNVANTVYRKEKTLSKTWNCRFCIVTDSLFIKCNLSCWAIGELANLCSDSCNHILWMMLSIANKIGSAKNVLKLAVMGKRISSVCSTEFANWRATSCLAASSSCLSHSSSLLSLQMLVVILSPSVFRVCCLQLHCEFAHLHQSKMKVLF